METKLPLQWKKVLILWNWSYKNLWDELILLWNVRLLQQNGCKVLISAYNPNWLKKFFSQFSDLQPIVYLHEFPKWIRSFLRYFFTKTIKELKEYCSVDVVVIWWWEILTEESVNSYWYWNFWLLPLLTKLKKINIYLMWGIQIPKKKFNISLFKWLLKYVNYIYARDAESVEELKNFWFDNVKFFMDTSWFAYDWESKKAKSEDMSNTVYVNLNKNWEKFLENLVVDCESFLDQWCDLKYICVSKWNSWVYNDAFYKAQLERKLNLKLEVLDWEDDFNAFIDELRTAKMVITPRLHLFLVSSYLWVPIKVYPYQKKILKMKKTLENLDMA